MNETARDVSSVAPAYRPVSKKGLLSKCWLFVSQPAVQIAVLSGVVFIIATKDITVGDFRHQDAWSHAMNGVYLLDLLREMPFGRFWEFTVDYYARYPAISLPYHPPGFPLLEAGMFALLGISVVAARFTVVCCAVMFMVVWYKLVQVTHNRAVALFSGLLIAGNATVAVLSREVMLEVPALAVVTLAIYFLHKAVVSESKASLYWWALAAAASVWFKQTVVFVLPLALCYFLVRRRFKRPYKHIFIPVGIITVALIPIFFITWYFARFALVQVIAGTEHYGFAKSSIDNWFYYLRLLPEIIPAPVLIAAAGSLVMILWKRRLEGHLLYLLWFLCAYAMITYTSVKADRYAFFLIPPLYLFACSFVDEIRVKVKGIRVSWVLLACVSMAQCGLTYRMNGPLLGGYEDAAQYVVRNWKGRSVVVSAWFHGNFTFNIRRLDPSGEIMVLRAEKAVPYLFAVAAKWSDRRLHDALRDVGAKYVVVESADRKAMPELARLRAALKGDKFALRQTIPLTGNMKSYQGTSILIYEFLDDGVPQRDFIEIPMGKMGRRLVIPLKRLP